MVELSIWKAPMFFIFFQVEWISQTWSFRLRGKNWSNRILKHYFRDLSSGESPFPEETCVTKSHWSLPTPCAPRSHSPKHAPRKYTKPPICIVHIVSDLCRGVLCGHAILVQTFTVEKPKACLTLVCPRSKCDPSSTCASGCCTHHGCHHISHGCAL